MLSALEERLPRSDWSEVTGQSGRSYSQTLGASDMKEGSSVQEGGRGGRGSESAKPTQERPLTESDSIKEAR